ncbi:hypothetical protein KKG52_00385, partial [Patescibacteria group bacterium]|nr:hypothetical protein [Patescibacteria group bacterium]
MAGERLAGAPIADTPHDFHRAYETFKYGIAIYKVAESEEDKNEGRLFIRDSLRILRQIKDPIVRPGILCKCCLKLAELYLGDEETWKKASRYHALAVKIINGNEGLEDQ